MRSMIGDVTNDSASAADKMIQHPRTTAKMIQPGCTAAWKTARAYEESTRVLLHL